ncbi:unnamed protein product [Protopolystoma xenopodis]|uniref:RIH domain-containing protein n=1 Tax=Protopolystoma xenopodis TaxID=117903 RepID=A0A448WI20_9PLAT|nr:unnamed protein product [Protopolystoma xenopodis]
MRQIAGQVLEVLCSLCLGRQGGAVRLNQDLIYESLLPNRDLLLQTKLVKQPGSMRPNLFVGTKEGGNMYSKWYFELAIVSIESPGASIRVGWGNTEGYDAQPGGGPGWGAAALGDDLFSYAFDGKSLWIAGREKEITAGVSSIFYLLDRVLLGYKNKR